MRASLVQTYSPSERPQEWWALRQVVKDPVASVYRTFPSIEGSCTVDDVLDHTTNEVFPRQLILGDAILRYARTVAQNFCLGVKKSQIRSEAAILEFQSRTIPRVDTLDANLPWWTDVTPEECLSAVKEVCSMEEKTILYLYYYNQKNYVEIAEILQMKENTVRSYARRARIRLNHYLTDNHGKK